MSMLGNQCNVNPNKLWLIKDPYLRHIRLKVAWKDIMSNERCHRFRMIEDSSCAICGRIETVTHQLWECPNARRIWEYCSVVSRLHPEELGITLYDRIDYNQNAAVELIKSQTFRYLIQMDRSATLTYEEFKSKIRHILNIEQIVLRQQRKHVLAEVIDSYLK